VGAINFQSAHTWLMLQTNFPPDPTPDEVASFFHTIPDAFNPRAATLTRDGTSVLYPIFVNNTSNANMWSKIYDTIIASFLMAYLLFGFPGCNTWGHHHPSIIVQTWMMHLQHHITFLQYKIDIHYMTLMWPLNKQWHLQHVQTGDFVPCKLLAQALGLLYNSCFMRPLGSTLSLQLQYMVNNRVKAALQGCPSPHKQNIFANLLMHTSPWALSATSTTYQSFMKSILPTVRHGAILLAYSFLAQSNLPSSAMCLTKVWEGGLPNLASCDVSQKISCTC